MLHKCSTSLDDCNPRKPCWSLCWSRCCNRQNSLPLTSAYSSVRLLTSAAWLLSCEGRHCRSISCCSHCQSSLRDQKGLCSLRRWLTKKKVWTCAQTVPCLPNLGCQAAQYDTYHSALSHRNPPLHTWHYWISQPCGRCASKVALPPFLYSSISCCRSHSWISH